LSVESAPGARPGKILGVRSVPLAVIAVALVIFMLGYAKAALIPITLAVLLAYALMPLVGWLKRVARIPTGAGALLALLVFVGVVGCGASLLQPQVTQLIDLVPKATQKLKVVLHQTALDRNSTVRRLTTAADELEKAATTGSAPGTDPAVTEHAPFQLRTFLWNGTTALIGMIAKAVVVLALSYFLLVSGHDFKRKLVRVSGSTLTQKKITVEILDEIDTQIQRYLVLQVGASAVVGLLTGVCFALLGLENALFWGVAAGVLHMIPYIGPPFVLEPAAVYAYHPLTDPAKVLVLVTSAVVIVWIVGMVVLPWITQRMASLNAVATFVSLIVWDWLWGVPGLLLGVPIMMSIMAVCERIDGLGPIAEFLNSEPPRSATTPAPSTTGGAGLTGAAETGTL
jgi:predicted PurR-regulated permease PerM